jgi:DNA (cytosine-5)-methyltransferase 1
VAIRPFDCLSLCSGYGGLDLAARLVFPRARSVCNVEREAWAVACLVEKMRGSLLAQAPVWGDARTFDGRPWRGVVDCVLAGIPCQGNSLAGKRLLDRDPRDLWPDCRRVLREVGCEYLFLENVAGFLVPGRKLRLTAPAARVLGELAEDGFDAEWLTLAASDVGATHPRRRFWLFARRRDVADARHDADAERPRVPGRQAGERQAGERQAIGGEPGGRGEDVADAERHGREGAGQPAGAGAGRPPKDERGRRPAHGGGPLADADGHERAGARLHPRRREEGQGAADALGAGGPLEHAGGDGLEGEHCPRRKPGAVERAGGGVPALPLFPPGPLDADGWRSALAAAPWLAPAIRPSEAESAVRGMADGIAADLVRSREHRLRLGGNGVVPLQGGVALAVLWKRLNGVWPWEADA